MAQPARTGPIDRLLEFIALIGRILYYIIKFIIWLIRKLFPRD